MASDIIIHARQHGELRVVGRVRDGSTDARAIIEALNIPGVTEAWVAQRPPIEVTLPTPEERAAIAALTPKIKTFGSV